MASKNCLKVQDEQRFFIKSDSIKVSHMTSGYYIKLPVRVTCFFGKFRYQTSVVEISL